MGRKKILKPDDIKPHPEDKEDTLFNDKEPVIDPVTNDILYEVEKEDLEVPEANLERDLIKATKKDDIEKKKPPSKVEEIILLHNEVKMHYQLVIEKAIRTGKLLTEIKEITPHGNWIDWINKHMPFDERLSQRYMEYYKYSDKIKYEPSTYLESYKEQIKELKNQEKKKKQSTPIIIDEPIVIDTPPKEIINNEKVEEDDTVFSDEVQKELDNKIDLIIESFIKDYSKNEKLCLIDSFCDIAKKKKDILWNTPKKKK